MGILGNLGASLGIGAMSVRITAPSRICAGETIEGVIQISGGKVDQQASGLSVALQLCWETEDDEGRKQTRHSTLIEQRLAFSLLVAADSLHEIAFSLTLPAALAVAPKDHWHAVSASVDIPSAIDAGGASTIRVYPARPMGALLQALTDELGWPLSDFDPKHAPAGQVRALFSPPASLHARVDRLRLDVGASEGTFAIHAMLDLKEGLWRALTKQDERFTEFQGREVSEIVNKIQIFINKWTDTNPS